MTRDPVRDAQPVGKVAEGGHGHGWKVVGRHGRPVRLMSEGEKANHAEVEAPTTT